MFYNGFRENTMDILAKDSIAHLRRLAMQSGSRLIGTPGNRAAADYIAEVFRQAGMAVDYQEIACPDWKEESIHLESGGEIWRPTQTRFHHPARSTRRSSRCAAWPSLKELIAPGKSFSFMVSWRLRRSDPGPGRKKPGLDPPACVVRAVNRSFLSFQPPLAGVGNSKKIHISGLILEDHRMISLISVSTIRPSRNSIP